jgi:hypothetical protein
VSVDGLMHVPLVCTYPAHYAHDGRMTHTCRVCVCVCVSYVCPCVQVTLETLKSFYRTGAVDAQA